MLANIHPRATCVSVFFVIICDPTNEFLSLIVRVTNEFPTKEIVVTEQRIAQAGRTDTYPSSNL